MVRIVCVCVLVCTCMGAYVSVNSQTYVNAIYVHYTYKCIYTHVFMCTSM